MEVSVLSDHSSAMHIGTITQKLSHVLALHQQKRFRDYLGKRRPGRTSSKNEKTEMQFGMTEIESDSVFM